MASPKDKQRKNTHLKTHSDRIKTTQLYFLTSHLKITLSHN